MGALQVWSTDPLPEHLRFAAWAETMQAVHVRWTNLATPVDEPYAAHLRYRLSGDTRIADCRCSAIGGRRDLLTDSAEVVGIQLNVSGSMDCGYGDDRFTAGPGDLFVWSSAYSGEFETSAEHRQLTLIVPRARVPSSLDAWLEHSSAVSARPGTGLLSVVADQIRGITREMDNLGDDALSQAVDSLLDLLGAAVAPARDSSAGQRSELRAEAQRHALERLHDPHVSAASIAAAHAVSVRTLHLAFAEGGTSVARWIRQQRLERCRRDLAGATGSTTVTEVAFRWGFTDAAHFSRVFKEAFGVPPRNVMPRHRMNRTPA